MAIKHSINVAMVGAALCGVLLLTAPAAAQAIKAGLTSSTISSSPQAGTEPRPAGNRLNGFVGGVSFLLATNDPGGWQFEALVRQQGVRNLLRRGDEMRLTYIEFPVLLHLDLFQRGPGAIFVIAGPSPAFKLQSSYTSDGAKQDIGDRVAPVDVGLTLGGGVEHRRWTVDARYTLGLRTAFTDADLDGTFKNRALTVMAGLRYAR